MALIIKIGLRVRVSSNTLDDVIQGFCNNTSLVPQLFSSRESAHMLLVLDHTMSIAYVCDSMVSITGIPTSQIVARPLRDMLVESAVNTRFLENVVRECSEDKTTVQLCTLRAAKGKSISVSFSVQSICSEHGMIGYSCLGSQHRCSQDGGLAAPYLLRANEDPKKILAQWNDLGPKEQEILSMVANGVQNKVAATRLGVAVRTIESRRSSSMKKMGVRSVADLIRIYLAIHLI